MADQILTLVQIEDLFRSVTMQILGIPEKNIQNKAINQEKVRIAWATGGAPSWKITEDVTFIKITPADDPIIQQRDVVYTGDDAHNSNRIVSYTRNHLVDWTIYGPACYENADAIRNGLYQPEMKELLSDNNIALITNIPGPRRVPELFDGRWWQRCDLTAQFNEAVIRYGTIKLIETVAIGSDIIITKG